MSIFKSKQKVYNAKTGKYTPIWQLNTNKLTVTYTNPETLKIKRTAFHTDYIMYHLHCSADKYPDRLQHLVDNGEILDYLDDLEIRIGDAIDSQVEHWKKSDKEYQAALESGDYLKATGLANMLVLMAKEVIPVPFRVYDCMVYV